MRAFGNLLAVAVLGLAGAMALADDVITNLMSPIASYQYPNDLGSEALTNGGVVSPIASYQYWEWPGDDILRLDSSSAVNYYYQFPDAPALTIFQTNRTPSQAEISPWLAPGGPSPWQLKTYSGGVFTTNGPEPDPNRMTVVLTHGWNSSPNVWARDMAGLIQSNVTTMPNILAWDWSVASTSALCGSWRGEVVAAAKRTGEQGDALAIALLTKLGTKYSQRIHFIGHSLGTLVNAYAADYLHEGQFGGFAWTNTQVTVFDDAEVATDLGCLGVLGAVLFDAWNPLAPKPYYYHPLPRRCGWADNYISAFGMVHPEAANVILISGFPGNPAGVSELRSGLVAFHGYPCDWYAGTIGTDAPVMGHHWSYERGGVGTPPATNTAYVQSLNGSLWQLEPMCYTNASNYLVSRFEYYRGAVGVAVARETPGWVAAYGDVIGQVVLYGPVVGSVGALTADRTEAFVLWLETKVGLLPGPGLGGGIRSAGSDGGNVPAYAWLPLAIPADAVAMSFHFKVEGDWQGDALAAALNGTNVLRVSGNTLETNVVMSSGPIDVMAYAGQTNEFFVGIVGGTSSSARVTIENLVFYSAGEPTLQAQSDGQAVRLTWPVTPQQFGLEVSSDVSDPRSWMAVTNPAGTESLEYWVTNVAGGGKQFYRLKRQ